MCWCGIRKMEMKFSDSRRWHGSTSSAWLTPRQMRHSVDTSPLDGNPKEKYNCIAIVFRLDGLHASTVNSCWQAVITHRCRDDHIFFSFDCIFPSELTIKLLRFVHTDVLGIFWLVQGVRWARFFFLSFFIVFSERIMQIYAEIYNMSNMSNFNN